MTIQKLWSDAKAQWKDLPALGMVGSRPLSYQELDQLISAVQAEFAAWGLRPGDKVALWANNHPGWGAVYLAATTAGLVIVPILPDFTPGDTARVLAHAEARVLVVGRSLLDGFHKWKAATATDLDVAVLADLRMTVLEDFIAGIGPTADAADRVRAAFPTEPASSDLAAIIYTSGTTGSSKGVMLTHGNIASNVVASAPLARFKPGQCMVSVLPLAHTYECSLGFLVPLHEGAHVWYLGKPPAPAILMPALASIRPQVMLTVPLFMEKIYRARILPSLTKGLVGTLAKVPGLGWLLAQVAGAKLRKTFGGRLHFFGIGGAPLAPEVATFLDMVRFPYAIGYGLTETSPLVAGSLESPLFSTGPVLRGVEVRIAEPRTADGIGEILVRGPNVMAGYYKDPAKTAEAIDQDGWFHTGDLGMFGTRGALFIKGRSKNLILGPSGENIYPEAIEALINQEQAVLESLVIQRGQDLVAKVVLNLEKLPERLLLWAQHRGTDIGQWSQDLGKDVVHWGSEARKALEDYLVDLRAGINKNLARFSWINCLELELEPFQKTATLKIKRYMYR